VVKRLGRLALLAPFALFASAACTQVLDLQDAWIDPSLTAGTSASNGGTSSLPGGGSGNAGGAGTAGSGHNHGGGSTNQAGTSAVGANAGADNSSAGAGGSDEPQSTCDVYCDSVMANCTGTYEQYRTRAQCMEVCKRLPEGAVGDQNVNTVQCRIRQAHFASAEAFLYCKSSGPLGAGKCGSNCESYCSLMDATCTQSSTAGNVELSYFENTQACLSNCAAMPDDPGGPTQYSSSATIDPNSLVGNNIYCRTYHAAAGIEQDAASEHCPHAMGGDPCIAQ
jgi:hypothetical protein